MKYTDYAEKLAKEIMNRVDAEDLPPKGAFFYHQGVFLSGMLNLYEVTGKKEYYDYVKRWLDYVIDEDGDIIGYSDKIPYEELSEKGKKTFLTLDHKQPVIIAMYFYEKTKDERYKKAIDTVIHYFKQWKTNELGGYWHMETEQNQMWLDGAYMAGPMSMLYDKYFGDEALREKALDQIVIMHENMRDNKTGLYFHGFDTTKVAPWADKETGLSKEIWGRALGWYAFAICDILEYAGKENKRYEKIAEIEKNLLENLKKYQDESGLWYEVVDKPNVKGNWVETSCTCLFAYAYQKAAKMGIISKEGFDIAKKAFAGLEKRFKYTEAGYLILDNVCVGTCIDEGTYEHYINRPTCENDLHGAGAFLLMCSELERGNKND